jgi:hypothetical protein
LRGKFGVVGIATAAKAFIVDLSKFGAFRGLNRDDGWTKAKVM